MRTWLILSCNLNYTELVLPLIITSPTGGQQACSAENSTLTSRLQTRHSKSGAPESRTWCCHFMERGKEPSDKEGSLQHQRLQLRRGLFIRMNASLPDPDSNCYSTSNPVSVHLTSKPEGQEKGDAKRMETDEGHSSACNCLTARWQQNAEHPGALGSISCSPRRLCKEYCIFNKALLGSALITLQHMNLVLSHIQDTALDGTSRNFPTSKLLLQGKSDQSKARSANIHATAE